MPIESTGALNPGHIRFSIVIPAHNTEDSLRQCVESVLHQDFSNASFEVIVADDCSSDRTHQIAEELAEQDERVISIRTAANGGPGAARNAGIEVARGDWILFLDSDDTFEPGAFKTIHEHIAQQNFSEIDAVAFNWAFVVGTASSPGGRKDADAFSLGHDALVERYLSLHMDGSVIYIAVRRDLIKEYRLAFASGYHEDVDFLFRIYYHARRVSYLDAVLYRKNNRPDSIVNTVSIKHLTGFMRAWRDIGRFLVAVNRDAFEKLRPQFSAGLTGVIATRVREIYRHAGESAAAASLYRALYEGLSDSMLAPYLPSGKPTTKYAQITSGFLHTMREAGEDDVCKADKMRSLMNDLVRKSWSCIDLHHSAFLAPDQVRTCCKRFFVDGQMRGDVSLIDIPEGSVNQPSAKSILLAKQSLHDAINKGESSACDGCPFLEFKDWGAMDELRIGYLSMEHHSICNLQCSYCSETYYGGMKPRYDVESLVDDLRSNNALEGCATVVWGGGEPTSGKGFARLVEKLVDHVPTATHRVLTNSVTYSKAIQRLLDAGKISITTSVDAGDEEKFLFVRGRPKLRSVMSNLQKYASVSPQCVTVKYIFTEDNHDLADVRGFVELIEKFDLGRCNFQISSDFKKEAITEDAAIAMIVTYGLLTEAGCQIVFFDDLLRQRLSEVPSSSKSRLREELARAGLADTLADPLKIRSIAVWGAGWLAKYLIEKSRFCEKAEIAFFVDSTPEKIGTTFMGRKVFSPDVLLDSDIPVTIAACQSLPIIHRKYMELGLDPRRLVRQLIL